MSLCSLPGGQIPIERLLDEDMVEAIATTVPIFIYRDDTCLQSLIQGLHQTLFSPIKQMAQGEKVEPLA